MSQIDLIKRNTESIIGEKELAEKLRNPKRRLRVKLGVDPTRPDLTFGHMVVFNKLRQFQDMGHEACLIIGDFTATIGDPSGRSALRPALTAQEVKENAATYLEQAFQILDDDKTTVNFNSEWFGKMSFADLLDLARKMTVARMLERDDFAKRYAENRPISIVEFLYPLIQGYDSVMLRSDVEIGGSDQLFNMLVGRDLQRDAGQEEQAVITMPLLVGLDGTRKMSKSLDNYIAFNDEPRDMFGKIMSIPDETMWTYYRLLLDFDDDRIEQHKRNDHPMDAKKNLAMSLVATFHSMEIGQQERDNFTKVFSESQTPDDMPEFPWEQLAGNEAQITLGNLLAATDLFPSKKEARRLVEQGAVKINNERADVPGDYVEKPTAPLTIQAGKRIFFRVNP